MKRFLKPIEDIVQEFTTYVHGPRRTRTFLRMPSFGSGFRVLFSSANTNEAVSVEQQRHESAMRTVSAASPRSRVDEMDQVTEAA